MAESTCTIDGCEKAAKSSGALYCSMHYERRRKHGSFDKPQRKSKPFVPCTTEGCEGRGRKNGLCDKCYKREWHLAHYGPDMYGRQKDRRNSDRGAYLFDSRAYYQKNRETILAKQRAAYEANPDVVRARSKRWASENRVRRREQSMRRNARKRNTQVEPVRYDRILAQFGMVCHICGGDIGSRADLHFDHVIALAKGGTHTYDNIRPSHAVCNMRKH